MRLWHLAGIQPNQRQMRFWHLTGVNLRKNAGFFLVGGLCPPDFVRLNLLNPNQR